MSAHGGAEIEGAPEMTDLDSPYKLAAEGWHIFPVGRDKKPLIDQWDKKAAVTRQGIEEFTKRFPGCNRAGFFPGQLIIDIDPRHGGNLEALEAKYGKLPRTRTHRTGGGGLHLIYRQREDYDIRNTVSLGGLPGIDRRGNGGYIVLPGSIHESGGIYEVIDDSPIAEAPLCLLQDTRDNGHKAEPIPGDIPHGQRNATLTSLAGTMQARGLPSGVLEASLLEVNRLQCKPPLPDEEVMAICKSITRYPLGTPSNGNNNQLYIRRPFAQSEPEPGQIADKTGTNSGQKSDTENHQKLAASFDEVLREAGRMSKRDIAGTIGVQITNDSFRKLVQRRVKDGQARYYRGSSEILEWVNRDYKILTLADYRKQTNLNITLPLGLNDLVKVPPGSVIGAAGFTSAGKSALLLDICNLNVGTQNLPVYYWFNEMSTERMLLRLEDYPKLAAELGKQFKAVKQADFEFYDVLEPDAINLIDYLDLDGDGDQAVFMIGAVIKKLQRALGKGVVIYALQKKDKADFGYGGTFSAKLSNLYLSMDTVSQGEKSMIGRCKIIKAKDWEDINPVGFYCSYYTGGKHGKLLSDNLWRRDGVNGETYTFNKPQSKLPEEPNF
jgi:hypothetical protein